MANQVKYAVHNCHTCGMDILVDVNRSVPKDKFILGIESKILDDVGPLDKKVFALLEKQFVFNLNLIK